MRFESLDVRRVGPVEYLTLNRPDVRNAFNQQVIAELTAWARSVPASRDVRCAVMAGSGKVFCAGADVGWMREAMSYSYADNLQDATRMAEMFASLDSLPFPLIGRVHGAALGGGCGLAAVCDIVVAEDQAVFGFTEVKLGILPAVISPYAVAKIGRSAARELFLTGMRFGAQRAKEIGLVHAVVPLPEIDGKIGEYVMEILGSGAEGIAAAKALIARVWSASGDDALSLTTETIAARRTSAEGQEGLRAFLEKRQPAWISAR